MSVRDRAWHWPALRSYYRNQVHPILAPVYATSSLLSLALLIASFGFVVPDGWMTPRNWLVEICIYFAIAYELLALLMAPGGSIREELRSRQIQAALTGTALVLLLFREAIASAVASTTAISSATIQELTLLLLFLNQATLVLSATARFLRRIQRLRLTAVRPALIFALSFAALIVPGWLLLMMPRMHAQEELAAIDAFFLAVSAVCVTGLSPVDISTVLGPRGQLVLILLVQAGGLGLVTLTSFFAYFLTGSTSISAQVMLRDLMSAEGLGRVKSTVRSIALTTFALETIGAVYLYITMPVELYTSAGDRAFQAAFQAISAFCNAGFALHADSLAGLLTGADGYAYIAGHSALIVCGGLGFPVLAQLGSFALYSPEQRPLWKLSTRIVLISNAILWGFGAIAFALLEGDGLLANLSHAEGLLHSVFFSITSRTAGFHTFDFAELRHTTTMIALLLMWIGASPLSTGGGIKTTTIALAIMQIYAILAGRERVELAYRTVAPASMRRAFAVVLLSIFAIFSGFFGVLYFETAGSATAFSFLDYLFECVSAFGTAGLSRGVTESLSAASQLIVCGLMLSGRIGMLTLLIALVPAMPARDYRYPEEAVLVG